MAIFWYIFDKPRLTLACHIFMVYKTKNHTFRNISMEWHPKNCARQTNKSLSTNSSQFHGSESWNSENWGGDKRPNLATIFARIPRVTHNCTWSIGCTWSLRARSLLYIGPNLFRPPLIRSWRTAEKEKLAFFKFRYNHHHSIASFQNRSHWIEIQGIWYLGHWSNSVIN